MDHDIQDMNVTALMVEIAEVLESDNQNEPPPLRRVNLSTMKNNYGEIKQFASGEAIIKEGDTDSGSMYFLLEGKVQVIKDYRTINERFVATLLPGDLFGEVAMFLHEPRTASVIALGDVVVTEINRDDVEQFMTQNPEIAYMIVEILCNRLRNVLAALAEY